MYNFPEQYSDALRLLCEGMLGFPLWSFTASKIYSIVETLYVRSYFSSVSGSSKRTLCLEVWNTFMSCIGCVPSTENDVQGSSKELLGDEQVLVVQGWYTC